ncbi:uncharacterized protein LOC105702566 isoform X2 [Orussus abietinus]|nr:uncharacterized protein LOC105702566 isoform X2 [Orussus abietinus]
MHCLGAVTGGTASPNGVSGRGGVLNVVRALGVLVNEGRIQGPPRGYKEGPHCSAPLQAAPNNHLCEKDSYLCDRYHVLIREIADRTAIGSFLCIEVLLCSDCPCGLAKATCKDPVFPIPFISIPPWQHSSEMLLEYWCISIVPSKGPEMMNCQGLYQAVRSRLHFSQVAAWWSRSCGANPSYIATRVVPYNEDNLRRFREPPTEHTFPLADSSDGNSIKVTVWALPRMEEVPVLICPIHPKTERANEEGVARALTPTKNILPVPAVSHNPESLVLPALVDDRLQTPCNEPGKHHCRCEEEDGCPPSPSIRPNGERKRRRSLPCGPVDASPCPAIHPATLPSVQESAMKETTPGRAMKSDHNTTAQCSTYLIQSESPGYRSKITNFEREQQEGRQDGSRSSNDFDRLDRSFRLQMSIGEQEGNVEKRYKPTVEVPEDREARIGERRSRIDRSREQEGSFRDNCQVEYRAYKNEEPFVTFAAPLQWPYEECWNGSSLHHREGSMENVHGLREKSDGGSSRRIIPPVTLIPREKNFVVNPFGERSPFHESNPGPSTYSFDPRSKVNLSLSACSVHQSRSKTSGKQVGAKGAPTGKDFLKSLDPKKETKSSSKDLSQLMSKLTLPEEREKTKEEGGILDWFSKVPGRVLGVTGNGVIDEKPVSVIESKSQDPQANGVKLKNCNLELSQREFDEVLAVLRARTPSGRRRGPLRTLKRTDKSDRSEEGSTDKVASRVASADSMDNRARLENNRAVSFDGCVCKYCRRNDQLSVTYAPSPKLQPLSSRLQIVYKNKKPGGGSEVPKWQESEAEDTFDPDKSNKSTECRCSASNKADVLLEAILRTSKDRKGLSDISNGTRPRTGQQSKPVVSADPLSRTGPEKPGADSRIAPYEDERSLQSALNKRFNRFRQFFKREQETRETLTSEGHSKERSASPPWHPAVIGKSARQGSNHSQGSPPHPVQSQRGPKEPNRVKRRINYSDSPRHPRSTEEDSSPEGYFPEPIFHSTNSEEEDEEDEEEEEEEDTRDEDCFDSSAVFWIRRDHQAGKPQSTNPGGKGGFDARRKNSWRRSNGQVLENGLGTSSEQRDVSLASSLRSNKVNHQERVHVPAFKTLDNGVAVDEDEAVDKGVPSAIEQERFRRSLENAASMVFHSRTGLPLTSSPAPLRRGSCCFDYDSSLNSVSSKRSALFELNTPPSPGAVSLEETDRETENLGEGEEVPKRRSTSRSRPQSHALLGNFEESALNGRLEPVSTVHGFTAELGASGSFCPKHRKLPVTVFFYTLGDNDKVSTPYLAHINLGKKGYQVPRSGTIQVTLLNPLGTVVKMFVVLYDLSDMPPRSHTFLRQRTLRDKTLRYLVHLRFMSSKSGRIYLHTDIRMIICRKSDVDTASEFGTEPSKELRSYIHGPTNPKFSPRC